MNLYTNNESNIELQPIYIQNELEIIYDEHNIIVETKPTNLHLYKKLIIAAGIIKINLHNYNISINIETIYNYVFFKIL